MWILFCNYIISCNSLEFLLVILFNDVRFVRDVGDQWSFHRRKQSMKRWHQQTRPQRHWPDFSDSGGIFPAASVRMMIWFDKTIVSGACTFWLIGQLVPFQSSPLSYFDREIKKFTWKTIKYFRLPFVQLVGVGTFFGDGKTALIRPIVLLFG